MRLRRPCGSGPSRCVAVLAVAALSLAGVGGCASEPAPQRRPEHARSRFDLPAHHFIYEGMEVEMLRRLVGEPRDMSRAGRAEVWYYNWGVVVVEDGLVRYKFPPAVPGAEASEVSNEHPSER